MSTPEERKKQLLADRLFAHSDTGVISTLRFDIPANISGVPLANPVAGVATATSMSMSSPRMTSPVDAPSATADSLSTVVVGPIPGNGGTTVVAAVPQEPTRGNEDSFGGDSQLPLNIDKSIDRMPIPDQNSLSKSNIGEVAASGEHNNDDLAKRRSPKLKRPEGDSDGVVNSDTNSRGEAKRVKLITNYFVKENTGVGENPWASIPSSIPSAVGIDAHAPGQSKEKDPCEGRRDAVSGGLLSTKSPPSAPSSSNVERRSTSSRAQHSATAPAFDHQPIINELKRTLESTKIAKEQAEGKIQRLESDLKDKEDRIVADRERRTKLAKAVEDTYRKMAYQNFRQKREQLALNSVRIGKLVPMRMSATQMADIWEDGYATKELNKRTAQLLERKEELEQRKKRTQTLRRQVKKGSLSEDSVVLEAISAAGGGGSVIGSSEQMAEVDLDLATEIEVIKMHMEQLKRDEIALAEEKKLLESEKAVHQKDLKRCQAEERSRFYRDLPLLHKRYVLQSLLGKGGFSEVWKALDIIDLREVAVKVHQLNPSWTEERKQSYIRHVTREYLIHKELRHPRIVHLYDVFEIDINSFATVLEYCEGIDLDERLKRQRSIPEKDARAIFMQIMSGLRYLNKPLNFPTPASASNGVPTALEAGNVDDDNGRGGGGGGGGGGGFNKGGASTMHRRMSIIHFDLKPANILFDETGDVKITDFGLSKVIDEATEGTSMELTSQGAGTYWYLPPECFAKGPSPPRISSKVDVWSAGVIFYQMLYGVRPFGEGKSQETVWSEGLIVNSKVEFPTHASAPKVSDEAKDLIKACLTSDQKYRPDVTSVCQHPYLKNK